MKWILIVVVPGAILLWSAWWAWSKWKTYKAGELLRWIKVKDHLTTQMNYIERTKIAINNIQGSEPKKMRAFDSLKNVELSNTELIRAVNSNETH